MTQDPPISNTSETSVLDDLSNVAVPDSIQSNPEFGKVMDSVVKELLSDEKIREGLQTLQEAQVPSHKIVPEAGFVIKTYLVKSTSSYPSGFKVFINVTHSAEIPAPPLCTDEEIRKALEAEDGAAYKVPMSLAPMSEGEDKGGKPCLVFDTCIHSDPYYKTMENGDFKLFIIELAMEWVEEKNKMALSREFTLPKLKHKGPTVEHIIRREKRANIVYLSKKDKVNPRTSSKGPTIQKGIPAKPKIISLKSMPTSSPSYRVSMTEPEGALVVAIHLPGLVRWTITTTSKLRIH